ncbi:hypothetical protein L593_03210 [Salinarchaeum sp. Harcht-Bsk1]|uniref:LVIVD repeat-containing protein n=1 Tax=Salinarchaeum sp. Harcht-Bsk1 TaxID=1333523 RepID=UPI0003423AC4|nr:hypothetical protein [Salinarchaeum sp. Harcht-Bsk1]AGN00593.1 hypothetical protein L593_03210 [Salinarchaeum sp. Harcht-Bsk1]
MRRRDVLAGLAGAAGAIGVYGAASVLTSGDPGSYEPLGSVDLEGTRELVSSDDGSTAFLAVDDGIATVDCSTPSDPTVLAERRGVLADDPDGPLGLVWDVSLSGDRLLAAGPAQPVPGSALQAALLFDVADPADPQLLDVYSTEFPIHNCYLEDGYAYLTAYDGEGNPLVICDAGDGVLTEVGRWSLFDHDPAWSDVHTALRQLHDVTVQDGVAYLPYWDAGTYLVDVSDPTAPSYLGHTSVRGRSAMTDVGLVEIQRGLLAPPGNSHFVTPDESGDLIAVGREAWAVPQGDCSVGGPAGIDLYDASDPTEITHHATIDPPESYANTRSGWFTTAHNVDLRDGRCYSSWYFGGVKVHDVSNPGAPEELTWWRKPEETSFWTAQHAVPGEYFLASSADDAAGYADSIPGRVYVFPDREGRQPNAPELTAPPEGEQRLREC